MRTLKIYWKEEKFLTPIQQFFLRKLLQRITSFWTLALLQKKKIGNAVKRNKIKRRLRNIMNDAIKTINMNLNYSYLFIAKKNIYDANYKMIKDSIIKDLIKVKWLKWL